MKTPLDFNLLSAPSKMPCFSFSLPAGGACPASKLTLSDPKSICNTCYAMRGHYVYTNVQNAQAKRFAFVRESLKSDGGKIFVDAIIAEIKLKYPSQTGFFRIHDSGDLFSEAYINCWYDIVSAFPNIKFWVPTREYAFISKRPALLRLASLPNIAVKPSAITRESLPCPEATKGLDAASAVFKRAEDAIAAGCDVCPVSIKTNPRSCVENGCFKCFEKSTPKPVAYLSH